MITVSLTFNKTPALEMECCDEFDAPEIGDKERAYLRKFSVEFETAEGTTIFAPGSLILELFEAKGIELLQGTLYSGPIYNWWHPEFDYQKSEHGLYGVRYQGKVSEQLFHDSIDALCFALDQAMAEGLIADEDFFDQRPEVESLMAQVEELRKMFGGPES
jgi:hypothetical protein